MKLTIPGEPIALARPRFDYRRGFAYNPQEKLMKSMQNEIRGILLAFEDHQELIELEQGDVFLVELTFHISPPCNAYNGGLWGLKPPSHKDLDNLIKYFLDVCNGLLYKDDRAIIQISAKKVYSDNPRTELDIMPKKLPSITCQTEQFLNVFSPGELAILLQDLHEMSKIYEHDKNVLDLPDHEKYFWLANIGKDLISFADKYSDKLKKIKTKKQL